MAFAAAASEHPLPTHAIGEVVGQVLEHLPGPADLAFLFVTEPHGGALEDLTAVVRTALSPRVLVAATAVSIVGDGREIEGTAAVSLWAATMGDVAPVRLGGTSGAGPAGLAIGTPAPDTVLPDEGTLILIADPFSFDVDDFLRRQQIERSGLVVIGGLASAGRGPGGNQMVLDEVLHHDGAIGVLLPPDCAVSTVVSQGCRPIGEPFVVTSAERNVIRELAGRPALERLQATVSGLDGADRELAGQGLHIGLVIDEHRVEFERGDFLIRNIMGADPDNGAVAVGEQVEVGQTVQFQVRDARTADEDLSDLLGGHQASAALLFTCTGRGYRFFGLADHDAALLSDAIDGGPTAGMFCAGEIGPVGGRSFVHGFTASIALFDT